MVVFQNLLALGRGYILNFRPNKLEPIWEMFKGLLGTWGKEGRSFPFLVWIERKERRNLQNIKLLWRVKFFTSFITIFFYLPSFSTCSQQAIKIGRVGKNITIIACLFCFLSCKQLVWMSNKQIRQIWIFPNCQKKSLIIP